MGGVRFFLLLALLGVVALFVAQNAQVVELRFLFWRLAMSQALLVFFAFAGGAGVGWVLHAYFTHRRTRRRAAANAADRAG